MIDHSICYPCRLGKHEDCYSMILPPDHAYRVHHCQCDCKKREEK